MSEKRGVKNKVIALLQDRIFTFNAGIWLKSNWKALCFLFILVVLTYSNSLGNEFVSDDRTVLTNQSFDHLGSILSNPLTALRNLLYYFIIHVFGKAPVYLRLLNIFFHLGNVFFIFLILYLLAGARPAFFAAAILAVHPIEVESVAWISGGCHCQYTFFLLSAFLMYLFSIRNKVLLGASIFLFLLALLTACKAAVFPFILALFLFLFLDIKKTWKQLIPFFLIDVAGSVVYLAQLGSRMAILKTAYSSQEFFNPLIQVPVSVFSYLELIFWPAGLTLYHSEMSFTMGQYFLKLFIFLLFLGVMGYFYKRNRHVFFWLSFFIIGLLPVLLPFAIFWIVAERYVYFSSIGIFVVVALGFDRLCRAKKFNKAAWTLFFLVITALLFRTVYRNVDWRSEDNLWLAAAKTSPSSSQNHNNLGDYYMRHGKIREAVAEFKVAILLKPGYADAYHNLGDAYLESGKVEEAVESYKKALFFNPQLWQSHQRLGAVYFNQGDYALAEENFLEAILLQPDNADLHAALRVVHGARAGTGR